MAPKEATTQVAFRLPESLLDRLDVHLERMVRDHPGLEFTRVDAVRTLLARALDAAESADRVVPELERLRLELLDLVGPFHTRRQSEERWRRLLHVEWPGFRERLTTALAAIAIGAEHERRELHAQIRSMDTVLTNIRKVVATGRRESNDYSELQFADAIGELLRPVVQLRDAAKAIKS